MDTIETKPLASHVLFFGGKGSLSVKTHSGLKTLSKDDNTSGMLTNRKTVI